MLSRGVTVDLIFTAAAGIATIVCVLLTQRYKVKRSLVIRLFFLIMFATILLEMRVAVATRVIIPASGAPIGSGATQP